MIFILTGPIRTGKTTALLHWSAKHKLVNGLLCPDDTSGKRYFLILDQHLEFPLELKKDETVNDSLLIKIGPFRFLKQAFTQANNLLISIAKKADYNYLIIDELGKLELQNTGLHKAAAALIPMHELHPHKHLIIVVRDSLLEAIISHYNITNFRQLTKNDLTKLKEAGAKTGHS